MGQKKQRSTGFKRCVCNKCMTEGHAPPNTPHRRCSGNAENPTLRTKGEYIPGAERGKWE